MARQATRRSGPRRRLSASAAGVVGIRRHCLSRRDRGAPCRGRGQPGRSAAFARDPRGVSWRYYRRQCRLRGREALRPAPAQSAAETASQAAAHRTHECVVATPRRFGRLCWAVHRSTSGAGAGHGGYQPAAVPDVSVVQRRRWHRLGHGSGHCGIHRRKELPGRGTACEHHRLRCTRPGYRRLPLGSPAAAPPGGATGRHETVNRALDGASTDLGESRPREGRAGCSAAFWKTSAITRG